MSGNIDAGHKQLVDLAQARMPFGKDLGRRLIDLPESVLVGSPARVFLTGSWGDDCRRSTRSSSTVSKPFLTRSVSQKGF